MFDLLEHVKGGDVWQRRRDGKKFVIQGAYRNEHGVHIRYGSFIAGKRGGAWISKNESYFVEHHRLLYRASGKGMK